jgi:hypothetical protein
MNLVELESVDRVEITILLDNVTDALLVDQDGVRRIDWPRSRPASLGRSRRPTPG